MITKTIAILLVLFGTTSLPQAQNYVQYDFDPGPDEARITHIFINPLNVKAVEIPDWIHQFNNLREIVFFDQIDRIDHCNHKQGLPESNDSPDIQLQGVAPGLAHLNRLKVLKLPTGNMAMLPDHLPKNLKILQLPPGSDLNPHIEKIIELQKLEKLVCILCDLSDESLAALKRVNPKMQFVVSQDDIFLEVKNREKYGVHVCDMFEMFDRMIEAENFFHSFTEEQQERFNIYLE